MSTPIATPVTPIPRIALPNPHLRKPSLSATVAQDDSVRNSFLENVPVPTIPKEHQRNDSGLEIGQAVSSYSPIDKPVYSPTPTSAAQKYTPRTSSRQHAASPRLKSNDSGYQSGGTDSAKSPVVPMRSMFPVYNPAVSLSQQHYYPQRPIALRTKSSSSHLNRQEYYSPASAWTPIDRALGPPSAPPSIANFAMDVLTPRMSTPKELSELWEATHGMEPNPRIKSYDLELAR